MKESDFWRSIRPDLKGKVGGWFFRVENSVGVGQFDVNYVVEGVEGWLELKVWPRKLRDTQWLWFTERREAGAKRMFVLVRVGADVWLVDPEDYWNVETKADLMKCDRIWTKSEDGWDKLRRTLRL